MARKNNRSVRESIRIAIVAGGDGAIAPVSTLTFDKPGVQPVSTTLRRRSAGEQKGKKAKGAFGGFYHLAGGAYAPSR